LSLRNDLDDSVVRDVRVALTNAGVVVMIFPLAQFTRRLASGVSRRIDGGLRIVRAQQEAILTAIVWPIREKEQGGE